MVFYPDFLPPPVCSPVVIELRREHEFFPQPQFDVGEWIADGLILGLRYDPLLREWSYWIETPELEPSTRWWPVALWAAKGVGGSLPFAPAAPWGKA